MRIVSYLYNLFARLLIAILLSVNSLMIFYFVFTPLTIYPSYWLLNLFYPIIMQGNFFFYNTSIIQIIDACIAGSAYYLLALLNLLTKGIDWFTRIKAFIFGSIALLILNIFRIVILSLVLFAYPIAFNNMHISFWIIGSTIFVVAIWLLTIKIYKIKEIPIYSDIMEVLKLFKK